MPDASLPIWRVAATVSGVGLAAVLALIVWRGQPRPLPEPVARHEQAAAGAVANESDAAAPAAGAPVPVAPAADTPATDAPAPAAANAATLQVERALAASQALASQVRETQAPAPEAMGPQAPAPQAPASRALAAPSLKAAESRAEASRAEAVPADGASSRADDEPARLLQQYFPDALQRVDAREWEYWLLLDPAGRALRQGMRRVDASPPLATWLQQSVPESRGARADRQRIGDGRGGSVDLLVMRIGTGTAP